MLDTKKVDKDVLDEIIQLAEGAMVRPFSKKKPQDDMIDEMPEEEGMEEEGEEEFSDDDLASILDEYERSKGR